MAPRLVPFATRRGEGAPLYVHPERILGGIGTDEIEGGGTFALLDVEVLALAGVATGLSIEFEDSSDEFEEGDESSS